nr:hypothetical protein [Burkholderia sp. ABCPW 11]
MSDLKSEVSREALHVPDPSRRRSLIAACGAHAVHDGLTDVIYVLLPIWQAQFALNYAQIGLLRGLYSGVMRVFSCLRARQRGDVGASACWWPGPPSRALPI